MPLTPECSCPIKIFILTYSLYRENSHLEKLCVYLKTPRGISSLASFAILKEMVQ